ncbi:hypothetical protein SRABI96_02390 [Peribacillus sp. Bi96]|nr:hypothetical protein SRABI96_02390 [Peribacillus sp. Bi96]
MNEIMKKEKNLIDWFFSFFVSLHFSGSKNGVKHE